MRTMSRPMVAGLVLLLCAAFAPRADGAMQRPFPLVTVTGEGSVAAKPDIAEATAGVTSEAKTPLEASKANAEKMAAVIAAIKEAGIADADIRTTRFTISPVHTQRERGEPRVTGYRVSNQVTARVRDLSRLGEILDKVVGAGANDISGVAFVVSDPSKLRDDARKAAFADAKRKADLFATAAGAQIGRAVSIAEDEAQPPRPYRTFDAAMARQSAPTPIEAGAEIMRTFVTVSFELHQ